jgi:hypothetical protein
MQKDISSTSANSATQSNARRITTFFYGSFMRREVMARGGFQPDHIETAKLSGFDIHLDPHANISRSDQHSIYGILVRATHDELHRLYSMDGVGVFLPEAVVVETCAGTLLPAICYIPPALGNTPPDLDYLERLVAVARSYDFPEWYVNRLARFQ